MATYSLSIYSISINKRNKPADYEYLDCFDSGKSLPEMIDEMLLRWHVERHLYERQPVGSDDRRVSRIKQDSNGDFMHFRLDPCISGIIESGAYGTEESIMDYKTGDESYRKKKSDAPMVPFYFCFYIPRHSKRGYLVLERIGNNGIYTMLHNALIEDIGRQVTRNYVVKIEPFVVKAVLDGNINSMIRHDKVFLRGVKSAAFTAGVPMQGVVGDNNIDAEIVLSFRPSGAGAVRWLFKSLLDRKDKRKLVVDNIECQDVAFQVKIGDRYRKVSICNLDNLGTNMDITRDIAIGPDGYPVFESVEKEACRLISFIKDASEV